MAGSAPSSAPLGGGGGGEAPVGLEASAVGARSSSRLSLPRTAGVERTRTGSGGMPPTVGELGSGAAVFGSLGVGGSPRTSWNSRVLAGDERGACSSWCDVCIGRGVEGSVLSAASVSSMENGSMMVCNGKRNGFSSGRRAGAFLTGPVGRWFKCVRGGNRDKNVEDAGTQSV